MSKEPTSDELHNMFFQVPKGHKDLIVQQHQAESAAQESVHEFIKYVELRVYLELHLKEGSRVKVRDGNPPVTLTDDQAVASLDDARKFLDAASHILVGTLKRYYLSIEGRDSLIEYLESRKR